MAYMETVTVAYAGTGPTKVIARSALDDYKSRGFAEVKAKSGTKADTKTDTDSNKAGTTSGKAGQ